MRNSTMIGIVGAGGIGGTLLSAFQRYDYDFVFGIVLCIIALICVGALAGTCAIAFHSIGFIGKMLSEALEESNKGTIEALSATGAPRLSRIL